MSKQQKTVMTSAKITNLRHIDAKDDFCLSTSEFNIRGTK